jgi:hypothetical protein
MSDDNPGQESARELAKLLISLSSAIIAISATFVEKHTARVSYLVILLPIAWILLLVSLFYGIKSLIAFVNAQQTNSSNWWGLTKPPLRTSWVSFRWGVIILSIYAFLVSILYAFNLSLLPIPATPPNISPPVIPAVKSSHAVDDENQQEEIAGHPSALPISTRPVIVPPS